MYARIMNVTIHGEEVPSCIAIGLDQTTEPVQVDHLVRVVVLNNFADVCNSLDVLIIWTVVMKGVVTKRITIRCGEVDSKMEVDFTATDDVVEESVRFIDPELGQINGLLIFIHSKMSLASLKLS